MAPITVDPSVLGDAASRYANAYHHAARAIAELAAVLDGRWGCAGTDSAGATWAEAYDPAAYETVLAATSVAHGFAKIHDLLAVTAVNHADTEHANTTPPIPPEPDPTLLSPVQAPQFRRAYGGDTDAPLGWGLISRWVQGHAWPNGDPDGLRALGTAWRSAAEELRAAADITDQAWPTLERSVSEEIPRALAQMDGLDVSVDEVAAQCTSLAAGCDDWARSIDDAHREIIAILAGAVGAGLVIGGVVGVLTAGTGTPVVEAGIGGSAGAAIVGVLVVFDATAAAAVGATAAAGIAAGGVVTRVQPLLDALPTRFDAANGRGGSNDWNYHPAPRDLPAFPDARAVRVKGRRTWRDRKGSTYEWDYQHGAVEKYDKSGRHLGEYDPNTGTQTKPPNPARRPQTR